MRSQHIGVGINMQLLSMEIDFNEEESTETSIFINFSIREYVDEIRKKNPAKCWPFGSLRDPDNKVVSSYHPSDIICSEDTTEFTEAPNLSKFENFNRKDDLPETTTDKIESLGIDSDMGRIVCNGSSELTSCKVNDGQNRHKNSVDEGAKIRHNVAADNNEAGRNRPPRKSQKFRLLSDIYKDPASEFRAGCDRTNPENVNRGFVAEIEDELDDDDVTLAAYFRKRKGVEITDSTLKKKRDIVGVEEPSVDQDRKSNPGPKDSIGKDSNGVISRKKSRTDNMDTQTMPEHKEDFQLRCSQKNNRFAKVSSKEATGKEKENEDSEMEVVMLLARHFNEEKQILRELETNTTCACVKGKIRERSKQSGNKPVTKTSSKTPTKHPFKKITKEKLENTFCSVQRRSLIPVKATTGGGFQSHIEMSMTKGAGIGPNAQNCATLVCSFNRNPADFSTPDGENKFKFIRVPYRLFLFFSAIAALPWFFLPPPVNLRSFVSFTASPSPIDSICCIQSKVIYIIDRSRARYDFE
ncbi:hypothetical protein L1987_70568 [Smallanthus sonchifolius]|uniref:Uncharacterized protein n=1 Tax=Smallanthus sonchifolius TaxID=185202 RepID=A0ACB9AP76_9ASTR|nr:hypothetical protein L1987_70568 [Smallanthus sonchifolius]